MAWTEPKTNWGAGNVPVPSDFNRIEENMRIVGRYDRSPAYAVATGTANSYVVTLDPAPASYYDGMCIAVKINVDSTAASTINVNGLGAKGIKRPAGSDALSLKANGIYSLRYNGTNFILLGEGGEYGTAGAPQVLTGYTLGTDSGVIPGTMDNNGPSSAETYNLTTEGAEYTISGGFHTGLRKIKAAISGLVASVIRAGSTVGGIPGTFTADATASASDIVAGKTAYANGNQLVGTRRGVKSVQRGRVYMSGVSSVNVAISNVNPSKCVVLTWLDDATSATSAGTGATTGEVNSSTNLLIQRTYGSIDSDIGVSWEVIEFDSVKSFQTGEVGSIATAAVDVTISAVDTSKAMLFWTSRTDMSGSTSVLDKFFPHVELLNSTTIRMYSNNSAGYTTIRWFVVELD